MIGRISNKALEVVQAKKPLAKPVEPPSPTVRSLTGKLGGDRFTPAAEDFVNLASRASTALRRDWPRAEGALRALVPEVLADVRDRIKARPSVGWQSRLRELKAF